MLRRLLIQDFVLVDRLELDFRSGFGVLTGETGAGKSILLDALSLLLGERADGSVVRVGCEKSDLVAEFDLAPDSEAALWLASQDLAMEETSLLVRRVVEAGGRSRAYLNGMPVTAGQLRELGEFLADIHGQHAHHALLKLDSQRQMLDAQSGLLALAREVAGLFRAWQAARQSRQAAEKNAEALSSERELLQYQEQELRALNFDLEAWSDLNQEHARLANAAALLEGAGSTLDALRDGDQPLAGEVSRLASRLGDLAAYDPEMGVVSELLSEATIRLEEAAHALCRYLDHSELEPARLAELEQRIEAVVGAARKYRVQPEALPELLAGFQARLAEISDQSDPEALRAREASAREAFEICAKKLSEGRRETARKLGEAVSCAMQELAMPGGRFDVALIPEPEGSAYGLERVEFLVAANPHQELRPLAKVASGGELSRIGLAIQVIASEAQSVPTLLFDEVDVGIGGGVAEIVGRRLRELGRSRQVLCVTHLPQVAAQADWQWRVSKESEQGQMRSRVRELDEEARVEEIARMLGGVNITDTTRRHAAELLAMRWG